MSEEGLDLSGRPDRVVGELTDEELVNLLAEESPARAHEKDVVKREFLRRLESRQS